MKDEKRFEIVETTTDNHIAVIDKNDMTTHQMLDWGVAEDVCILLNELNDEVIELRELINIVPDFFFRCMEDMWSIFMNLDTFDFFCVDVSSDVVTFFHH